LTASRTSYYLQLQAHSVTDETIMNDAHAHPAPLPFSAAEMDQLHSEDRYAAGAVVVLMSVIFSIGLFMYSIIAYICS
jgi:hypothetical protein